MCFFRTRCSYTVFHRGLTNNKPLHTLTTTHSNAVWLVLKRTQFSSQKKLKYNNPTADGKP